MVAFAAFLIAVPWLIPAVTSFWVSVIAEILIWSLFAASVNLLFGYVGLLSFGQALYFGFGMYGVAIGIENLGLSFWPAFGLGIVASMAMALVTGIFAVRLTWHYFAIITVVFSLIFYFLALTNKWLTGGDDGINFALPPTFSFGGMRWSFTDATFQYFFILATVAICFWLMHRLIGSPLGKAFLAIRDNDVRASLIGLNVYLLRLIAFVLAGFLAGVAGAVRLLRPLRLGLLHVLPRVGRGGGVGDRRRRRHAARAHRRHQHLHHRARDRLDPLGAPRADRRRRRHPGGDLRAQGHRRIVARMAGSADRARAAATVETKLRTEPTEPVLRPKIDQAFRRPAAVDNLSQPRRRTAPCHHRPERRRQDDALQPDFRPAHARRGQVFFSAARSPGSSRTRSAGSASSARCRSRACSRSFRWRDLWITGHAGQRFLNPFRPAACDRGTAEKVERTLPQIGLAALAKRQAGTLSYGDVALLEIGMALISAPRPAARRADLRHEPGRDRRAVGKIRELAQSIDIVIIEHDMEVVFEIADDITVMARGRSLPPATRR